MQIPSVMNCLLRHGQQIPYMACSNDEANFEACDRVGPPIKKALLAPGGLVLLVSNMQNVRITKDWTRVAYGVQ